jgi:hypothetical protein
MAGYRPAAANHYDEVEVAPSIYAIHICSRDTASYAGCNVIYGYKQGALREAASDWMLLQLTTPDDAVTSRTGCSFR